jgi:CRP/FNR family transcriptional regulator, dissimilatory nitrate respiration regulator
MQNNDTVDAELRRNYLFSGLDEGQIAKVKQSMRVLQLEEGERLFDHGIHAERFFMVRSGQMKLFRLSLDGVEKVIEIIQAGQTFAEAVMFMERQNYPVSAEALAASEVYSFDSRNFMQVLRESTDTCLRLMADMSMRLHMRLNEIDHLTLQNATYRMINYLSQQIPDGSTTKITIELNAPKSIIASRLSIQPETFSRILSNLQKEGVINVHGKQVEIHDARKLREYGQ